MKIFSKKYFFIHIIICFRTTHLCISNFSTRHLYLQNLQRFLVPRTPYCYGLDFPLGHDGVLPKDCTDILIIAFTFSLSCSIFELLHSVYKIIYFGNKLLFNNRIEIKEKKNIFLENLNERIM